MWQIFRTVLLKNVLFTLFTHTSYHYVRLDATYVKSHMVLTRRLGLLQSSFVSTWIL